MNIPPLQTSVDGNTTVSELILIPVPEDNERQVQCSISLNPQMTSQHLPEGHTSVTTVLGNGNMGLFLKDSRVLNVTRKYWDKGHIPYFLA